MDWKQITKAFINTFSRKDLIKIHLRNMESHKKVGLYFMTYTYLLYIYTIL